MALLPSCILVDFFVSYQLAGRGLSRSEGRFLYTHTHIHDSSGIRTDEPSLRAGEDVSSHTHLEPRGRSDQSQFLKMATATVYQLPRITNNYRSVLQLCTDQFLHGLQLE
jgi:hypothetical protein